MMGPLTVLEYLDHFAIHLLADNMVAPEEERRGDAEDREKARTHMLKIVSEVRG